MARLLAFYLPQFHPIRENDEWWGKGFTEWTNVSKASPLFKGHYQPHLPADLGFYDLRLPEARLAQAELARAYGISGLCYYHYWFAGKRLLERPFDEVLAAGKPDFPFCLCWANESWSRRWLGEETAVLQEQTYSQEDDARHIEWLMRAFSDPRYIKINGRPLFIVYRPLDHPNPQQMIETFRAGCIENGLAAPYMLGCNAHCSYLDCRTLGFDGTLDFQPQLGVLPDAFEDNKARFSRLIRNTNQGIFSATIKAYDCQQAYELMKAPSRTYPVYDTVFVGWDNTPRRGKDAIVVTNSTPQNFETRLSEALKKLPASDSDENIVFINAWNEWAEGNHLEPDMKYGLAYLEAVKRAAGALS